MDIRKPVACQAVNSARLIRSIRWLPTEQQNQYTFRPRTIGMNATLHL